MAFDGHANFAYSTVATAPSPATSGTSLVVHAGDGAKFPTPPFNATVWAAGQLSLAAVSEIVRVTAISTDTLTITRAQESSSARSIVVGDQISATVTKKTLTDIEGGLSPGWNSLEAAFMAAFSWGNGETLKLVLSGAITTTNPSVVIGYVDITAATGAWAGAGTIRKNANGTTVVSLDTGPASGVQRFAISMQLCNLDTVATSAKLTILDGSAATWQLALETIQNGEVWCYNDGLFYVLDVNGCRK